MKKPRDGDGALGMNSNKTPIPPKGVCLHGRDFAVSLVLTARGTRRHLICPVCEKNECMTGPEIQTLF